jgi:hypothetical protein
MPIPGATRGCCHACPRGHTAPPTAMAPAAVGRSPCQRHWRWCTPRPRAARGCRPRLPEAASSRTTSRATQTGSKRLRCQSRQVGLRLPADGSCARRPRWRAGAYWRLPPRGPALPTAAAVGPEGGPDTRSARAAAPAVLPNAVSRCAAWENARAPSVVAESAAQLAQLVPES